MGCGASANQPPEVANINPRFVEVAPRQYPPAPPPRRDTEVRVARVRKNSVLLSLQITEIPWLYTAGGPRCNCGISSKKYSSGTFSQYPCHQPKKHTDSVDVTKELVEVAATEITKLPGNPIPPQQLHSPSQYLATFQVAVFLRYESVPLTILNFTQKPTYATVSKRIIASKLFSHNARFTFVPESVPDALVPVELWPQSFLHDWSLFGIVLRTSSFVVVQLSEPQLYYNAQNSWFEAVSENSVSQLEMLCRKTPFVISSKDCGGRTAIHIAAREGDAVLLRHLLRLGVPLDAFDQNMRTCLHYACASGSVSTTSLVLEYLETSLGDPAATMRIVNAGDCEGLTAIDTALLYAERCLDRGIPLRAKLHTDCAERILRFFPGASINFRHARRSLDAHFLALRVYSSIYEAVAKLDYARLHALLTCNVSKEERLLTRSLTLVDGASSEVSLVPPLLGSGLCENVTKFTALHQAVMQRDERAVNLLVQHRSPLLNVDALTQAGESAICLAVRTGQKEIVLRLLREGNNVMNMLFGRRRWNILHYCLSNRRAMKLFPIFLQNPSLRFELLCAADLSGVTPLHLAMSAVHDLKPEEIITLLEKVTPPKLMVCLPGEIPLSLSLFAVALVRRLFAVQKWFYANCKLFSAIYPYSPNHPVLVMLRGGLCEELECFLSVVGTNKKMGFWEPHTSGLLVEEELILTALRCSQAEKISPLLIALSKYEPCRNLIRKWCFGAVKCQNAKLPLFGVPLWRALWLTSVGTMSFLSTITGMQFLRHICRDNLLFCNAEKCQIAATALHYAFFCDPFFSEVTAGNIQYFISVIQTYCQGTKLALECHFPDKQRGRLSVADGRAMEPILNKMVEKTEVLPSTEWISLAAWAGCFGFVSRVIDLWKEKNQVVPVATRANFFCTLEGVIGLQYASVVSDWWCWEVIFEALCKGYVTREHKHTFPATEVLNAVVAQLPLAIEESCLVPQHYLLRSIFFSRKPEQWKVHLARALICSGFANKYSKVIASVVGRAFFDLPKSINILPVIADVVQWAVRVDDCNLVRHLVTNSQAAASFAPEKGPPLVHLACIHRSPSCFNYLLKLCGNDVLDKEFFGLKLWDICAALLWEVGLDKISKVDPNVRYNSNYAELFQTAFEPSLRTWAKYGVSKEMRVRYLAIPSEKIFVETIRFIQKQQTVSQWAPFIGPKAMNSALIEAIKYNNNARIAEVLLDFDADPECRSSSNGPTALHLAVRRRSVLLVVALLGRGANPNSCLEDGTTPLHEAYGLRCADLVGLLEPITQVGGDIEKKLDLRAWYSEAQQFHAHRLAAQSASANFSFEEIGKLSVLFFHAMIGRAIDGLPSHPYLQHNFIERSDPRFILVCEENEDHQLEQMKN